MKAGARLAFLASTALYGAAIWFAALCAAKAQESVLEPEYTEFYGRAEVEATFFAESPQFVGQEDQSVSFALEPTFYAEWSDGEVSATFTPFARADAADDDRSHFDIRELKLDVVEGDWDFTFGVDRVFWGKTEAAHLVDIINQTDAVEDLDDEDNLGQPMIRVGRQFDFGTVQAFYLPFFRERTFPGSSGRLRGELPVDEGQTDIRADGDEFAPSFALRYDGVFGGVDLGLSAFHGVSRDPGFVPTDFVTTPVGPVPTALAPVYTIINQVGVDAQYTEGPTLYKFEGIFREGQFNLNGVEEDYVGASGGIEYTLYQIFDDADLGLIAEYAYDSRGDEATTIFNNDVILGVRLALNDERDTSFLLTSAIDHEDEVASFRLEAQRRVSYSLVAEIEAQLFVNGENDPLASDFQDDSFVRFKLNYYW